MSRPTRTRSGAVLSMLCAAALPAAAQAEGSVFEVSCTAATLCDAAGACVADATALEFTVAPVSQDGSLRTFEVVMDGETFEARQDGALGPFVWDDKVLVPMGGQSALLVRQSDTPNALFLTCDGLG